jgi:hypothetical protein
VEVNLRDGKGKHATNQAPHLAYGRGMDAQQSPPSRVVRLWSTVTFGALLLGAVASCAIGLFSTSENYDGVTSFINPIAAGGCCGAVVLLIAALVASRLVYKANQDR